MVKGMCVKPNKGNAVLFWSMVIFHDKLLKSVNILFSVIGLLLNENYH